MGNAAGVRHYFIEAFTPYGYISLLPDLLREIKHTYLLTGGPGTGKSTMIKLTGIQLIDRGYDVDYIRSIREPDSVAGLFLPRQKICLLDKNEFVPQTVGNGDRDYYREIDFAFFCRKSRLENYQEIIKKLEKSLKEIEHKIIARLREDYNTEAKDVPVELKQNEAQSIQTFLALKKFLGENENGEDHPGLDEIKEILSKIKKNHISFYFLHGLQLDGWLNLTPRFIKDFDRICLEGEDSAYILRDILREARCLGQVMEIIVHPLKPYTITGIVFPEKNLAVWKGNPCKIEEQGFRKTHKSEMIRILEGYKTTRTKLKCLINDTVNFRGLDDLRSELLSSILADIRES